MKLTLTALTLTLLLCISQALAAPPATITYQGYLTGSNNSPINAQVAMTLALYTAPVGGTALWSEHQSIVPVINGVYSVMMGSLTSIGLPFDTVYYLGVAVGSDPEMTPRQELASVPYTFRAMGADKLNQVCGDGEILKYSTASASWSCAVAAGPVANSGSYTDLTNKPTLGALAAKGSIANVDVAVAAAIATSKLSGAVTSIPGNGLGTAATLDVGTGNNKIVQLNNSSQLPAVDGSQLTNVIGSVISDATANTKVGSLALSVNTTGNSNSAFGYGALQMNTTGFSNAALGTDALSSNTSGYNNIAIGVAALTYNTVASQNVAVGGGALASQSYDGGINYFTDNTAVGYQSLLSNNPTSAINGKDNTALGSRSLFNNLTGSNNIGIGSYGGASLKTGDYNIDIGNMGNNADTKTIRIGDTNQDKTFIAGIYGVGSLTAPQTVVIGSDGQLGSVASSSGTVTSVAVSGGTTGLTTSGGPVTTTGTITLSGTLVVANGGTGATGYTTGDLLYASSATALSKLADVATGNALISGGVGAAPSWGKVALTTHVSGTLPIANGGTGSATSPTQGGIIYANSTTTFASSAAGTAGQFLQSAGTGTPVWAQPGPASVQVLTSSGTYTTSAGVKAIIVELVGGGGGGGGVVTSGTNAQWGAGGGGGGGGAFTRKLILNPAASYTYLIGAFGLPGDISGTSGASGGSTTFNGGAITAPGGSGGSGVTTAALGTVAAGGAGGAAGVGGNFMTNGGAGGAGFSAGYITVSGQGGNSIFGGGGASIASSSNCSLLGNNGTNYGGGGSGAANLWLTTSGANAATGAFGAAGVITVYEYK